MAGSTAPLFLAALLLAWSIALAELAGKHREPACASAPCDEEDFAVLQHTRQVKAFRVREQGNERRPPACPTAQAHPWCNPLLPLDTRVQLLLKKIRKSELAPQIQNDLFGGVPAIERIGLPKYNYIKENDHGLIASSQSPSPTSFPQVILTASSFNKSLYYAIGELSASQARYFWEYGFTQLSDNKTGYLEGLLLQNNINIFRDPRWGRGQEVPGEDPFLTATYVAEWIKGVQALKGPRGVPLAGMSCKHFAGYSFEGGPTELNMTSGLRYFMDGYSTLSRHNMNAIVDKRDMTDTYLPAFESCITSGAKGSMCSYNQINGVPSCGNKALETDLMRGKWGFEGVMVTDCDSIADMYYPQEWKDSPEKTVRGALDAGTDISCGAAFPGGPNFTMAHTTLDMLPLLKRAVGRALRVRFQLGEFDPPEEKGSGPQSFASGLALAREAAQQSMVLLRNDDLYGNGSNVMTLPLKRQQKIALLGPLRNATRDLLGNYVPDPVEGGVMVSPLQGLLDAGADVILPDEQWSGVCSEAWTEIPEPDADVVVIVAGIYGDDPKVPNPDLRPAQSQICQKNCLESEGCDRYNISWPYGQQQLLDAAANWDIPVVLVVISGGPMDLNGPKYLTNPRAILWIGYPGQMGGAALADVLFGDVSPSGRLSQTFYSAKYVEATSITDMRMRPGLAAGGQTFYGAYDVPYPGRTYRFVNDPDEVSYVVYPFGSGLSYHDWQYRKGKCECCRFKGCKVSFTVSSTTAGATGATSALLFLRPPANSGNWAPIKELKAFTKVMGPSNDVMLSLDPKAFQLADADGVFHQTPGDWTIEVGQPVELTYKVTVGPLVIWPCQ